MKLKENQPLTKSSASPGSDRCLGPVADLEKHLPTDWWRSIFNSIYLKTDADVVENREATLIETDMFVSLTNPRMTDNILDLCCGQGRHSMELARRGFQFLYGIDRSRYLIRVARSRAQKESLNVKFSEGDARRIRQPDQSMNYVIIMGNSFGYFEQQNDDLRVLQEANRVLKEGGTIYLDITDGSWMKKNYEKRSWEWINQELLVCRERNLALDDTRLISREVVVHAEKGVVTDQFYAERLYAFEDLKSLLMKAGFEKIEKHQNITCSSTRNQDLGMMEYRMIVTAVSPKKAAPTSRRSRVKINCTVLMGDPKLPDRVKRGGQFNEEDFQTVNRLKEALTTLDEFHFSYFDDHKSILRKFSANPPTFVFNLCDEGWNNNPFMELHVPAVLDILNVPYTGAGPECLSLCYNKSLVRSIAQDMDIPTPAEIWLDPTNQTARIPSILPSIIKPAFGDSSVGITQQSVVYTAEDLITYFDKLKTEMPGVPILVQEFLEGREFTVGLIGNPESFELLPILEVDYSQLPSDLPKILGYESKWHPESPYWNCIKYKLADLDEGAARTMMDASINLFQRLKCRDYARFDFRMNAQGEPKLLEVNPNPGWCWDGKFAIMARLGNMSYTAMLEKVLKSAMERYRDRKF